MGTLCIFPMTVQRNFHRITFYAQRYAMKHGESIGKCPAR